MSPLGPMGAQRGPRAQGAQGAHGARRAHVSELIPPASVEKESFRNYFENNFLRYGNIFREKGIYASDDRIYSKLKYNGFRHVLR